MDPENVGEQKPLPAPAPKVPGELPLNDIQGDILSGFPKKTELWYFFQITDPVKFKKDLVRVIPLLKNVEQVLKDRDAIDRHKKDPRPNKPHLLPIVGANIAFSHLGFKKLNIDDTKLADDAFFAGQRKDAESLGDSGTTTPQGFVPDWEDEFKEDLHGVITIAGDSHSSIDKKLKEIEKIFGEDTSSASIKEISNIKGDSRPGEQSAHEHFGYLDGVSNPAIIGFDKNPPLGPAPIRPGIILTGEAGDDKPRDPWMVDGSFLVFRYLFQKVPEFDDFVERNALTAPGLGKKEGADLLGARLVGRWKSGAPIDITPFADDPELGADPTRNNNFHFSAEHNFQKMCPFASHIRKTNPRADLEEQGFSIENRRIMRRGIQFGPEVTRHERRDKKTRHGRGLLFACYQSSIDNGFKFIQTQWANNPNFLFATPETPGFDAIIGQGPNRHLSGTDPNKPTTDLKLDADWVIPKGGEYFFTPSLSGLAKIAA